MPETMAPAMITGSAPTAWPIDMNTTPMMLTVPNDVPVRKDMSALHQKARMRSHSGLTMPAAQATM